MRDVRGDLVLRPDRGRGLAVLATVVVVSVAIVAAILIGDAPTVFAPIAGALFAVLIILAIGTLLRSRIILTTQEIVVRGLFVRKQRSRSLVAEVVRATLVGPRGASSSNLFVLDAHRRLLVRVSGNTYGREGLDRLVNALGVPCGGPGGPVNADQFARTYPGLVSWVERHPRRLALAIAGVFCAAVVTLVLVALATAP